MTELIQWRLFLDDERTPTYDLGQVEIAIDSHEAIELVKDFGAPELMSLDHDLGSWNAGGVKPTAMMFLQWFIDEALDERLDPHAVKRVIVHSRNPDGARNLAGLWDGFAKYIGSVVRAELRPRQSLTR